MNAALWPLLTSLWPLLISWWSLLIQGLRLNWRPGPALVCVCILIGFCCFAAPLAAAPGLCLGPVCGDEFSRNPQFPWQLRLRVSDQSGQRERLVVDCRDGVISPRQGPVERGYAAAVARRACRLATSSPSPAEPEMLPAQPPMAALQRSSAPWP